MKCLDIVSDVFPLLPPPSGIAEDLDCEAVQPEASFPRRPDGLLTRLIRQKLDGSGPTALRTVDVRARQGHVRLEGQVPSYYLKQLAQNIAIQTPGVERVTNHLQVLPTRRWAVRVRQPLLLLRAGHRAKSFNPDGECHGSCQSD